MTPQRTTLDWAIIAWRDGATCVVLASDQLDKAELEMVVDKEELEDFRPIVTNVPSVGYYRVEFYTRRRRMNQGRDPLIVMASGATYAEAIRRLFEDWRPSEPEGRGLPPADGGAIRPDKVIGPGRLSLRDPREQEMPG